MKKTFLYFITTSLFACSSVYATEDLLEGIRTHENSGSTSVKVVNYDPSVLELSTLQSLNARAKKGDDEDTQPKSLALYDTKRPKDDSNEPSKEPNFTSAAQSKIKIAQQVSESEYVQVEGVARVLGNSIYGLPDFVDYLTQCVAQYKPGIKLNSQREIKITEEDTINLKYFSKYVLETLFGKDIYDTYKLTPKFEKFKTRNKTSFDDFSYSNNPVLFSLMYYFEDKENTDPVEISLSNYKSYNELKFKFFPCSDDESGIHIDDFHFSQNEMPYYFHQSLKVQDSRDTLRHYLTKGTYNTILDALYKFDIYKIEKDTYRVKVKLSSKENAYSDKFTDRKISNFVLKTK